MGTVSAPKVFVSHASEDKDRFVIPFATALRGKGVDAWVDKWEMLPGDSLVDKIFEEGLKEAAAVLIVISPVSISKPWVREELNAAVVKRIEKGTKLIPIVLESCAVPGALKSLVWESVKDVGDFQHCLSRVVDAVFGFTEKPPIGEPPAYVSNTTLSQISGLSFSDSFVLAALYSRFLSEGRSYISPDDIVSAAAEHELDSSMVSESLEVLAHQGYVELVKHMGPGPYHSRIDTFGVSKMLGAEEEPLVQQIGLCIVNDGLTHNGALAEASQQPVPLVDHAIRLLEGQGYLKATRSLSGNTNIYNVSPMLRRALTA
ncbi:toll/interleukin-1 receptor domain-containing protein [Burkholderia sp. D-99]|uniref:toll/interleukin-1 receptor domain-containing protein n=1 Tax=Burkholderia sp. D-99 TaxID=2717316 RepID=UPI001422DFD3|nr:toll/interleukin-1 receptor domain-containing protein [Burkholderia sp. D-99]NHV31740.1 toll/interleukin-1 receptor domain-containing protein [Burkholderia sp. D-99]